MSCLSVCNSCAVYKTLASLCDSKKEPISPIKLPRNFESKHFFFTTVSAPLDFAYRMYFYTIRLFILTLRPLFRLEELGTGAAIVSLFLRVASIFNDMFFSLKYTLVVCALTGDAWHNRKEAALRLVALYSQLNNGDLSIIDQPFNKQSRIEKAKVVNWWRMPFESSKCTDTPFSYIYIFDETDSGLS